MPDIKYAEGYSDALRLHNLTLDQRIPDAAHKQYISTSVNLSADEKEFRTFLENVFSHHETSKLQHIPFSGVDWLNPEHCTRYFHHHSDYYQQVHAKLGLAPTNPKLSYDELFLDWSNKGERGTPNHVSFLVGNIGIGKTTFICNYLCRKYSQYSHFRIMPVRVNLDVSGQHSVRPISEIISTIKASILTALLENGVIDHDQKDRLHLDSEISTENPSKERAANSLSHLLALIQERNNWRIALFLDNIDFLYHLGDRGFFADGGTGHPDRKAVREAHEQIHDLINLFWLDESLSISNLGISVVFSVRQDTLSFLLARQKEVPAPPSFENSIISLSQPTLELARSIIAKRFKLAVDLADRIPEKAKAAEIIRQCRTLAEAYSSPGTASPTATKLVEDLWAVSRNGLRDLIDQIRNYSWLEHLDGQRDDLNARFSKQYYPSILAYALGKFRRYTQFNANVPNIYLVNPSAMSSELAVPSEFKDAAFYTLWLKKMMVHYLIARAGKATELDRVVDTFCGKHRRGYPEALVRYILSSLFEVPTSELIEIDVGADGGAGAQSYVENILVTDRGRFIIERFCATFTYIQLIVDDHKLLLPKRFLNLFRYLQPDYAYLMFRGPEYGAAVQSLVLNKGRQALAFGVLLEEALEFDKLLYPRVYDRLRGEGVKIDWQGVITSQIVSEVKAMAVALKFGSKLEGIETEDTRRMRALVVSELKEVYAPCLDFHQSYYSAP